MAATLVSSQSPRQELLGLGDLEASPAQAAQLEIIKRKQHLIYEDCRDLKWIHVLCTSFDTRTLGKT